VNFTKNLPPVAAFLRKSFCWNAFSDLYKYNHVNKFLFAVVFIPLLSKDVSIYGLLLIFPATKIPMAICAY